MPIFLVIPLKSDSSSLDIAVNKAIKDESSKFKLQADRGWLIKHEGTTTDISNFIGITGQPEGVASAVGSAMVVPVSNYYGRGPTDMWEWLKIRIEQ
jgi:hypothetical protein